MDDSDRENTEGMSRRMLLTGGAAALAGIVASAVLPEVAAANNGDVLHVGDNAYGTATSFQGTTTGTNLGTSVATAMINRNLNSYPSFPVQAFGGLAWSAAPAGSAGIWGDAVSTNSYGVHATHDSAAGTALKVEGRTSLSRSGMGTVSKGASSRTVTVPSGVDTTSKILVTLQGNGGTGVYVKYAARTSATTFKVYLSKATVRATKFAWIVTD